MKNDGSPCLFSTFNPSNAAFILVDHVLSFSSPSLLHQSINEWEHFSYFQRHCKRFQSKFSGSPTRAHTSPCSMFMVRNPARGNHRDPILVRKNKYVFFHPSCNSAWNSLSLSYHLQALRFVIEILRNRTGQQTNKKLSSFCICFAFGWFNWPIDLCFSLIFLFFFSPLLLTRARCNKCYSLEPGMKASICHAPLLDWRGLPGEIAPGGLRKPSGFLGCLKYSAFLPERSWSLPALAEGFPVRCLPVRN